MDDQSNATSKVICYHAGSCHKSAACIHGVPHAARAACFGGDVCYDHVPALRMWCEPVASGLSDNDNDKIAGPGV